MNKRKSKQKEKREDKMNKHSMKTIFNDTRKHAEFLEHIKDTKQKEAEHNKERIKRCGDENYSKKIFSLLF